MPLLLTTILLLILNPSINYVSCADDDNQVVVFMVDGLLSRMTSGMYMPYLHSFVNHGVWDIHARGDISHSENKIGWISSLFGISPIQFGCDPMFGCGSVAPEVSDPYNIFDVLTDTLDYLPNIYSEDPKYTENIIGDVYTVRPFNTRVKAGHDLNDDLTSLSALGDRLVVFHMKQLEVTGFSDGWGSSNYIGQVACLDYQILQLTMNLWEYSPNKTTFILLSDRGGYHFSNHNFQLDTAQIVFAAWGYGVKQPPNIGSVTVNPTQIPKTILAMVDPDFETDAPPYWNAETLTQAVQGNPALHFVLGSVDAPTDTHAPLCIIPNTVSNYTLKIVCVLLYGIMFVFAMQMLKFRLVMPLL